MEIAYGTKDVAKLKLPPYERDLKPETKELFRKTRAETLKQLEDYIFFRVGGAGNGKEGEAKK